MSTTTATKKETATYTVIPDSAVDPVGYLIAKGWRPNGDPRKPDCGWYDPTKPVKETSEERVILRRELPDGSHEEKKGLFVTPPAFPVSMHEAVCTQVDRDDAALKPAK